MGSRLFEACQIIPTKRIAEYPLHGYCGAPLSILLLCLGMCRRAARVATNSSYDTPGRPLIEGLGWKTIQELIKNESGTMVFNSLNGLAPQYLSRLFTRNSACSSRILRNTNTDLRLPLKKQRTVKNFSLSEEHSCGIASQLSQSKHPPLAYLSRRYGVSFFVPFK